jgi:hypothetical protein
MVESGVNNMIYVIDRTQQLPEDFFSEHLPGSILEDGYLLTHNGITYELERRYGRPKLCLWHRIHFQ